MKLEFAGLLVSAALTAPALAADVTYRNDIAPLLKARCAGCHGSESPSLMEFKTDEDKYVKRSMGPRFDTYPDLTALIVWPETGALMRRLDDGANTPDKKPGNMFEKLGGTAAERQANLAIIKAWLGEGAWNLNRWSRRGDVPGVTKEQLEALKLKF